MSVAFGDQETTAFSNQDFFDHILRNDESYIQKWEHVREISVRAELVARSDDWLQGEFVFIHRL